MRSMTLKVGKLLNKGVGIRPPRGKSIWHNRDFARLWTAESISAFGSQVTNLAIPLIAVLSLRAGPRQMGILMACSSASYSIMSLVGGSWADRWSRRRLMTFGSWGSAVLSAFVPAAALLGFLGMGHLYIYSILFGVFSAVFRSSSSALLPSLVKKDELISANGQLNASYSLASVIGPTLAGSLVQALTAPLAMVLDAASFVVEGMIVRGISTDVSVHGERHSRNLRQDIVSGFHYLLSNGLLRTITAVDVTIKFFLYMVGGIYVLYAVKIIGVSPVMLGIISATGGLGWLVASLATSSLSREVGIGKTTIVAAAMVAFAPFLLPLATRHTLAGLTLLAMSALIGALGHMTLGVTLGSVRQAITPADLLGRVIATGRFLSGLAGLIGPLLGGFLGATLGLRPTLWLAASGHLPILIIVLSSPIHSLRELPGSEMQPQR